MQQTRFVVAGAAKQDQELTSRIEACSCTVNNMNVLPALILDRSLGEPTLPNIVRRAFSRGISACALPQLKIVSAPSLPPTLCGNLAGAGGPTREETEVA